uniref:TxLP1 n=1 Tax=Lychas mucronatus TaxID=172552 RepID=A0A0U1SBW5_LYCMC|nr:TxLP1 [Lychas mucronatus]
MKPFLIVFLIAALTVTAYEIILDDYDELDDSEVSRSGCLMEGAICNNDDNQCCEGTGCICPYHGDCTCM